MGLYTCTTCTAYNNEGNPTMEKEKAIAVAQAQSVADVKAHVNRIQEVMRGIMKADTHYGVIPGTRKPSLYKPGSEVLLTTFRIAVEPEIEDLSTADEIRYRVKARGVHQTTGTIIGVGVGECSSNEEKYRWRDAVCDEEFDTTDEDRRRVKFQRKHGGGVVKRFQVRAEPADIANTVLKMAKKRAQIDLCLTALAASDIFTQDAEDLPEGMQAMADDRPSVKPQTAQPQSRQQQQTTDGPKLCTAKQAALVKARLDDSGLLEGDFFREFNIGDFKQIPFDRVDDALAWIRKLTPEPR